MAIYRVQMEFPYFTNLPKDVAVNTFHVTCLPPLDPVDYQDVLQAFIDFYNEPAPTGTPVGGYLSAVIKRGSLACTASLYNLEDPEPRPPIEVTPFTLAATSGTTTMPLEAAVCLSMHSTFPAGEVRARRRGRVFIGPLQSTAFVAGSASTFPTVNPVMATALKNSAERLRSAIPAINPLAHWSIYSRVNGTSSEVVAGWIDDAPDTQRRRGQDTTARTTWP